jgi:thymidine kinase
MREQTKGGWIEVICGSMFSGKTQELIRRLRLAKIAKQKIQVFKHSLDTRYSKLTIISHDKVKFPAVGVKNSKEILKKIKPDTQVVGVDEAQFFDSGIVGVCQKLAKMGLRVIVSGLDQDYKGIPFSQVARLMAVAEYVTKNLAICVVCGGPANRTQKVSGSKARIDVGGFNKYEARCRHCFTRFK